MLAFMASRNVRETMAVVNEGKVVFASPGPVISTMLISHRHVSVVAIHLESLFILWSSIEYI